MNLNDMIYKRKSFRKYTAQPVDAATLEQIEAFCAQARPLDPAIKVRAEIINKENVKCLLPWITPQVIAIFSEETNGYLENAGFLFQQLDLYLQSLGLGSCWLGMGRLDSHAQSAANDGLGFVIMLTFGHPKDGETLRESIAQFKRKALSEISDQEDTRLESARLAPSSVNSQPWYFTHQGDVMHAYCVKQSFLKAKALGAMNRIDMGIALAHLYVEHPDTFRYFTVPDAPEVKNYGYIGSVTL